MQNIRHMLIVVIVIVLGTFPVQSTALPLSFDTEVLLLLTGPVSEATQETVLLIRRGDNFASKDSLLIGCVAGATAGLLVSIAPALGFVDPMVGAPLSATYVAGTLLLSCSMSIASSAAGIGTAWVLNQWHTWINASVPPTVSEQPPTPVTGRVSKPATNSTIKPANSKRGNQAGNNVGDNKNTQPVQQTTIH